MINELISTPSEMTDEALKEIRERVGVTTPGPWWTDDQWIRGLICIRSEVDGTFAQVNGTRPLDYATAEFLAHAREDVTYLLEVIDMNDARTRLRSWFRSPHPYLANIAYPTVAYTFAAFGYPVTGAIFLGFFALITLGDWMEHRIQ